MSSRWLRGTIWTVAILAVLYAPFAMTDVWAYGYANAPEFGQKLLSSSVSPEYVNEARETRVVPYQRSFWPMIVHSVLGGLLMLLGPVQLFSAIKRKRGVHRTAGVVYALVTLGSMIGAVFQVALTSILLGTVTAVTAGIVEIRAGRPQSHQRWMVLSFAFLMTAPLLRLEWGFLPEFYPGLSMAEINAIGSMTLGGFVAWVGVFVSRGLDPRRKIRGMRGTWVPWFVAVPAVVGGAVALWSAGDVMLNAGPEFGRLYWAFTVPFLICFAIMAQRWRKAVADERSWPADEWATHLVAMALVPPVALLYSLPVGAGFALAKPTAIATGLVVAWGAMTLAGIAVVALRLAIAEDADSASSPVASHAGPVNTSVRSSTKHAVTFRSPLPWQPRPMDDSV